MVEGWLASVELAAVGTPFVYMPLSGHAEQEMEVAPKLERLGIGWQMSFEMLTPQNLARAYTDAIEFPDTASDMNLPVKRADVATEVILNFHDDADYTTSIDSWERKR